MAFPQLKTAHIDSYGCLEPFHTGRFLSVPHAAYQEPPVYLILAGKLN